MPTSITFQGGFLITPFMALVESAEFASEPRTVVHDILDGPPIHTLRPAGPTRGTLHLGFLTERQAVDAMGAHKTAAVFTIANDESSTLNFSYVVAGGDIQVTLDAETAAGWVLKVPYSEVS